MKIQLDYDNQIITLEDAVNLGQFFEKLHRLVPDFKDWTLKTKTTIEWTNPFQIIPDWWNRPYKPWWDGPYYTNTTTGYTTDTNTGNCDSLTFSEGANLTGTYNLEI